MGLDMFLEQVEEVDDNGLIFNEFLYWRKNYPIMSWFDEEYNGVGNCIRYKMTREGLKNLRDWCRKVSDDGHFHECDSFEQRTWIIDELNDEWKDYLLADCKDTADKIDEFFKDDDGSISYWLFHGWW